MIKTCYNNGQKGRLCLIIDKCRRQKLCKRAQKISAAAPLRVKWHPVITLASKRAFRVLLLELATNMYGCLFDNKNIIIINSFYRGIFIILNKLM